MTTQFTPGTPRPEGAGRKPGTPNRATSEAKRIAEAMGCDPFEVLLLFASGNAARLGLPTQEREDGTTLQLPVPLDMRLDAAKAAVQFLYPKRKAIELDAVVNDGREAFLALPEARRRELVERMARRVLQQEDDALPPPDAGMDDDDAPGHTS